MATYELSNSDFPGPVTGNSYLFGVGSGLADTTPDTIKLSLIYDYIKSKTDTLYPTIAQLSSVSDVANSALNQTDSVWRGEGLSTSGFASSTEATGLVTYQQMQDAMLSGFDLDGLSAVDTLDSANDKLLVWDASQSAYRSARPQEISIPISTGVSGLGSGVAAFLAAATNDNLTTALGVSNVVRSGTVSAGQLSAWASNTQQRAATAAEVRAAGSLRELVTANRTYYVRPDGSNSNDGLSNTAGGAFLTIQKAADVVAGLDISPGFVVTVQVAAGTYNEVVIIRNSAGAGGVVFDGDTTTPSNVNVTRFQIQARVRPVTIRGFRLTGTNGIIMLESGGSVVVNALTFATGVAFFGINGSTINANFGTFTFESAVAGIYQTNEGGVFTAFGATMNLSSCVWNVAGAFYLGQFTFVWLQNVTFTGSATGKRYTVGAYSYLNTSGGGTSFIPGSTAGSVDTAKFGTYA